MEYSSSQKGFTLIELLIVISVMVFMAAAGIANTINSQKYFAFISVFKQTMFVMREPRMYSVTNYSIRQNPEDPPYVAPYYGVHISFNEDENKYVLQVFADMEGTEAKLGKYDPTDYNIGDPTNIDATKYGIKIYDDTNINYALGGGPVPSEVKIDNSSDYLTFLYAPPLATYQANVSVGTIKESGAIGNLYLKVYNLKNEKDINRFIAIFNTGIAEAFYSSALRDITSTN